MAKELRCGDVMPGCEHVIRADTEDEVMQQVPAHAKDVHGLEEVTDDVAAQVRSAIRDV